MKKRKLRKWVKVVISIISVLVVVALYNSKNPAITSTLQMIVCSLIAFLTIILNIDMWVRR